jgi:hypothetical protein
MDPSQAFFEREFAPHEKFTGFGGPYEGLGIEKILFAEFLFIGPFFHCSGWNHSLILLFRLYYDAAFREWGDEGL